MTHSITLLNEKDIPVFQAELESWGIFQETSSTTFYIEDGDDYESAMEFASENGIEFTEKVIIFPF
jgi:hypothetical protein